jgi:hypothetical protein
MTKSFDGTVCPLCQANNKCGVNGKEPCWCAKEKVPAALISQVPDELLNKSCICQACIEKFNLANVQEVK